MLQALYRTWQGATITGLPVFCWSGIPLTRSFVVFHSEVSDSASDIWETFSWSEFKDSVSEDRLEELWNKLMYVITFLTQVFMFIKHVMPKT